MRKDKGNRMEKFLNWVKKNNPGDRSKFIIAMAVFVGYFFCFVATSEGKQIGFFVAGGCIAIIIAMDVGRYFINQYLKVYEAQWLVGVKQEVSEILRFHSFDADKYFQLIRRKIKWLARMLGGCGLLLAFLAGQIEETKEYQWERVMVFAVIGIICGAAPYITWLLQKKVFLHQLRWGQEGKLHITLTILKGLFAIPEVIVGISVLSVATLLFCVIISDMLTPKIDETMLLCRKSEGFMYYFVFFLLAFLGGIWILCNGLSTKLSKVFCGGTILSLMVAICMLVYSSYSYTEFQNEEIIIYHFGVVKRYEIEDIQSFRIYAEEENMQIQMELLFKDGVSKKAIGTTQTYSDKFEEMYYSDYNFIADYVSKMQAAGVSGTLEEVDKLEEYVEELDGEVKEGLEKIVGLME